MNDAFQPLLVASLLAFASAAPAGEATDCDNGFASVHNATSDVARRVCQAADQALELFAACDLELGTPVTITLTDKIDPPCFGLFHCGEARIELLTPDAMAAGRRPESAFAHVPLERFFDSVVVHELTHALYDSVECPFENCMATAEYLAYGYQIESLNAADRAPFETVDAFAKQVPRDMINPFIVMMAPDRFAGAAWAHLNQREDQCSWRQGILSGAILFDHESP